jgi:excisionase family DNA binding protein
MVGLQTDRLSVETAAAAAGVSVDTIRRAYRSGALRAFRPGGTRRIVILRDDLQAWAFADEHLVARGSGAQLRPPAADVPVALSRRAVRQRPGRDAVAGSVERLREIERSA